MKTKQQFSLVLKIDNDGDVDRRIVSEKDGFSIGHGHNNDLIMMGNNYPKNHLLVSKKNGHYQLFLPTYVKDGELREGDSTLKLRDLMIHDILPRTKSSYVVKLTPKKQGFLTIGDTRIEFGFDKKRIAAAARRVVVAKFEGYSWFRTSVKNLFSDLMFKLIFLLLLSLNCAVLYLFKDYVVKVPDTVDVKKVQQRLTKFMMKTPDEIEELTSNTITNNLTPEAETANAKKSDKSRKPSTNRKRRTSGKKRSRGNAVSSSGLLGLIGGVGSTSKSSSVVDALVDHGLVSDLNSMLGGGTNLKVGRGNTKDKDDPLDQLIGTGGSGGIDDFLDAMDDPIETVTLKKKVRVNVAQATQKSGDEEALNARSESSVAAIITAKSGRITYYYEKYLKRNPNLRGKITIKFTIAANGFVTSAKVIASTANHPQLERDILNLIKRLKFDPIPSGTATFVYPFVLQKIN